VKNFEVLFDEGEASALEHAGYAPYGRLGFPGPPAERPWIYSNFVQSLDGIASFKGDYASGSHISQSAEDRWLMDLLRAHADAILLGIGTLVQETELAGPDSRGPVYRVEDALLRDLRTRLGRGRERNIFVTGGRELDLARFAAFDGERADAAIITTREGAARLGARASHRHVRVIVAGDGPLADLPLAMRKLRQEMDVQLLLCEGGPTLYGHMARAGLMDEKFLTISPVEVGQEIPPEQKPSAAEGPHPPKYRPTVFGAPGFLKDTAPWWRWMSCRRAGQHQFSRYRRAG